MSSFLPRSRRLRWLLGGLLLLALVARLALAGELAARQLGREATPPQDMWLYDQEASLLLAGDWTLSEAFPLLERHHELGIGHSTYLVTLGKPWVFETFGARPLVNAPLYPAALAAVKAVTGSVQWARTLQVLGTLLLALGTYALVRLLHPDARVAGLAGALVAFHPTTVFYAGFLLRTTLISLLLLALVLAAARYAQRPGLGGALALGALTALNHMAKGVLPFLIPLSLVALWRGRAERRGLHAGAWAVGFLLAASPLLVRNATCGSPLLHVGVQARVGLIDSNFEGADGVHLVRPPPAYVHAVMARGGHSDLDALRAAVDTHPSWLGFPTLLLKKLRGFTNAYEGTNNLDYHRDARLLSSLCAFPLSTWPLLALGLVGAPLLLRDPARWWPVLFGLAIPLAVVLASTAHARYRLPAVPYLAIGAAWAASLAWRRPRRLALLGVALALTLAWAWPWEHRGIHGVDVPAHITWTVQGRRYERLGDLPRAVDSAGRAIEALPEVSADAPPAADSLAAERLIALHVWGHGLALQADDADAARRLRESLARFFPAHAEALAER